MLNEQKHATDLACLDLATAPPATCPSASERERVLLTETQRTYLVAQSGLRKLIRDAFAAAFTLPLFVGAILLRLTRAVARIPLIGWVFALYGLITTVMAVLVLIVGSPLVALLILPITALTTRSKLRADLAANSAIREIGQLTIKKRPSGNGDLLADNKEFSLSGAQMESLRPALSSTSEDTVALQGSVLYAPNAKRLLAVLDAGGHELIALA